MGQNIGAKQYERVKKGSRIALWMTMAVIATMAISLFFLEKVLLLFLIVNQMLFRQGALYAISICTFLYYVASCTDL
ncbi:MAG: MATE family efflux transporter [Coprobacillus cateniformis]